MKIVMVYKIVKNSKRAFYKLLGRGEKEIKKTKFITKVAVLFPLSLTILLGLVKH